MSALDLPRLSRKGKEREVPAPRDGQKEIQVTDIDKRLLAFQRRTAGPIRKERADRPERPAAPARADKSDKSPKLPSSSTQKSPSTVSPRRHHQAPNVVVRPPEADPDDFSRRLKITSSPSPGPGRVSAARNNNPKLFNPDRDPIPIRRTAEPDALSDSSSSYVPRGPPQSHGHNRDGGARQLFDHKKDNPILFSVLARPPGSKVPTPQSSMDHFSASSASSYAPSISSSFTLSSTTDGSSNSSALFDGKSGHREDSGNNQFGAQLKRLYRNITDLEAKVKQDELEDATESNSRIRLKGKDASSSDDAEHEKWRRQITDHKRLIDRMHDMLQLTLNPNVPASLRNIPKKYNLIARLWMFGFHRLLENLRAASLRSPVAMEHLQDFILFAYTYYTGLYEETTVEAFRSEWLEALGDIARYRMAVAAMVTRNTGSTPAALTTAALSEADKTSPDNTLAPPPMPHAKSVSDAPAARIDDSPSPSIGVAAARLLELEPEKERWRMIAREWYALGLSEQPGNGKLHHHLGLLSREAEGEELRSMYHFVKSLCALHPFPTTRESILQVWSPQAQARRAQPDARVPDLFVLVHGMLFTNIQMDDFQPSLARLLERLAIDGAEEREWIMMAVSNIGALLEYGKPTGLLRKAGAVRTRETATAGMSAASVRLAKRAAEEDRMEIDEELSSPVLGEAEAAQELPMAFTYAVQLAFSMLVVVLRQPIRKPTMFARKSLNPYLSIFLTFLPTMLKNEKAQRLLERHVPWAELAAFFQTVPRAVMESQGLLARVEPPEPRWTLITSGCAPPLAEDWCLRGMEWVARKVWERGYWKSGEDRRPELEVLDAQEAEAAMEDGRIEDDEEAAGHQKADGQRWTRAIRGAVEIAKCVPGLTWVKGTREWRVEGELAAKTAQWREEERLEREAEARRLAGSRWTDDSMEVDDEESDEFSEETDDESESEQVKELKSLLAARRHPRSVPSRPRPRRGQTARQPLRLIPGYSVLVVDTNILLSSLDAFQTLVESHRWTVVVPLPVIMELDGMAGGGAELAGPAAAAVEYIAAGVRAHGVSLKVQTTRGNYLATLSIRTEEVDFAGAERNMDDLILKAALWHQAHWVDRSAFLQGCPVEAAGAEKVALLTLDRNLRLKARSRELPAASERDLAGILAAAT
ncbi:hypothetical protein HDZ31DRAFT_42469 [Schizophyllum fasciatum]